MSKNDIQLLKRRPFSASAWFFWIVLAVVSLIIWFKFSYPNISSIDLSVNRTQAVKIAEQYLKDLAINPGTFHKAVIFSANHDADRYFQKNLGFKLEKEFLKREDFSLFYWVIRFFKENDKEEFHLVVSSQSGQVISFLHTIPESAKRPTIDKVTAQKFAIDFLKNKFNFNPEEYSLFSQQSQIYDHRIDYSFIWHKNDVYILWKDRPEEGGAKLLTGATVSGDEILYFGKEELRIPDGFTRYIDQHKQAGRNMTTLFRLFYILLISAATFVLVTRKQHVVTQTVKSFYFRICILLFILNVAYNVSEYESILFYYDTTSSLASYGWQCLFNLLIQIFFITISILMPGLAGESLRLEEFPDKKEASFAYYIRSTFFSKAILEFVGLGYLVAAVVIGVQSALFTWGQHSLGVWMEQTWLTQLSSSYLPFLATLILAFQASLDEEIMFRLFGISWGGKIFKSSILAVIVCAVIWGFGHTHYLVFPTWFRGLEVGMIGIILGVVYLRYGLLTVLVTHYMFDAFWGTAPYILGRSDVFNFIGSIFILLLPLSWGIFAYVKNQKDVERELNWTFNAQQKFNLKILKNYLSQPAYQTKSREEILKEFMAHGWDLVVIEEALKTKPEDRV